MVDGFILLHFVFLSSVPVNSALGTFLSFPSFCSRQSHYEMFRMILQRIAKRIMWFINKIDN